MSLLQQALDYIRANPQDFSREVVTHLKLSGFAVLIAALVCLPLGVLASRSRIASLYSLNAVGVARAIPSIAILFLAYPLLGSGFRPSLLGLAVLACPPILINTNVGFRGVEAAVREAAYGMGMSTFQVLRKVEFPLALPVVIAGIRTSTVDVIASASLATFIGGGGLGDFINEGLATGKDNILLAGAISVALLTLAAEVLLGQVERVTRQAAG
ncbi:MAG: ABC transporter permease [Chloroflexota bacterium]|nr:MAG: glycine/betaine ABC transporter [Chloroflexota bacterium]